MIVPVELRPLGVGEKLDAAFSLYRRNFGTLIAIVAVIVIPFQLLNAILSPDPLVDTDTLEFNGGAVVMLLFLTVLSFVANTLATGSATKAIADDYLGETPNWLDSIQYAVGRLWPLVLGSILFGIAVFFGLIFFVIPGVILWVSWSIWVAAVIVEDMSATGAFGRSNRLVKGRRWPVFGYFILVYLIVWLITAIVGGLLTGLLVGGADAGQVTVAGTVIGIALALFTTPFVVAATVVLYFDQRVRVEAFDVDLLASQISGTPVPQAPTPKEFGSLDGEEPPEPPQPFPPSDQR